MGIWDSVCSTAEAVKQRLPDPSPVKYACGSIGSAVHSAAGRFRSGAPDIAGPVAGIVRGSYDRGVSAASAVDRAVRVEGVKWAKESVPDKEVLEKIGGIAWELGDLALDKYTTQFTGGLPAYKIVKDAFVKKDVKAVDHVKMEELLRRLERLEHVAQGSSPQPCTHRPMVGVHQKPEDVIRVFMMNGFVGGKFIHDQVVLRQENLKRDVLLTPFPSFICMY